MLSLCEHLRESEASGCGRKGGRSKFFQQRFNYAHNLYSKDLKAHFSCVNAIEFSNSGDFLISGGDDKRVLLWSLNNDIMTDRDNFTPKSMKAKHNSNIFALEWDNEDRKVFSAANDHQVIVHDVNTGEVCDVFVHEDAVLDVSVNPSQSQIFATACESGQVSLYDLRLSNADPIILVSTWMTSSSRRQLANSSYLSSDSSASSNSSSSVSFSGSYHSVHYNPVDANLIAVGNEITGASVIDVRMNRPFIRFKSSRGGDESESKPADYQQNVMSVRFNKFGTQLAALRFKLKPVIYELNRAEPIYQFDHQDYANSCTLKSCCFAGDSHQYLISGSDNFSLFVWPIPDTNSNYLAPVEPNSPSNNNNCQIIDEAHLVLRGHRSIVNQTRYNDKFHMIASSGVEKLVKIWSPYELPGKCTAGGLLGTQQEYKPARKLYKFNDIFTVRNNNHTEQPSLDDFPIALQRNDIQESLDEDRIMIAFFDAQIRRQKRFEEALRSVNKAASQTPLVDSDELSSLYSSDEESDTSEGISTDSSSTSTISSTSSSSSESDSENSSHSPTSLSSQQFSDSDSENPANKNKRKLISLRDRLRSLRHRRTLNLTNEPDYLNVLDSLNVATSGNEGDGVSARRHDAIDEGGIEILAGPSSSSSSSSVGLESNRATTSQHANIPSDNKNTILNLKNQKRKIEMNRDDVDNEEDGDARVESDSENAPVLVSFKKYKRNHSQQK